MQLKKRKITSVEFFKFIYNTFVKNYKIRRIDFYNKIKCIEDNVKDKHSRYLLLGIRPSLEILIKQRIEEEMKMIKSVFLMERSPFINDENMEYQDRVINDIQEYAKNENGHILFFKNLNSIYFFLYNLFNMNYSILDNKSYVRFGHTKFNDQLSIISKKFRIVIMEDIKYIDKLESPFLNKFEKIIVNFNELQNDSQKKICRRFIKRYFQF